ncbi:MAG: GNAT family N-acetyltransferase [Desulfuromonadales bacterium]|nr:GNAT family N-acetyltransferase [Desulfuromonadales bacterium]
MLLVRETWLVYTYSNKQVSEYDNISQLNDNTSSSNVYFDILTLPIIDKYFKDNTVLSTIFKNYLHQGASGIVLHDGENWMSYGMISMPGCKQPPQLPYSVKKLNCCWIFYCHTNNKYRGRGLYKKLLKHIDEYIHDMFGEHCPDIFIDTQVDNIPARRAILSSGFRPVGIFYVLYLWIPKIIKYPFYGIWRNEQAHNIIE